MSENYVEPNKEMKADTAEPCEMETGSPAPTDNGDSKMSVDEPAPNKQGIQEEKAKQLAVEEVVNAEDAINGVNANNDEYIVLLSRGPCIVGDLMFDVNERVEVISIDPSDLQPAGAPCPYFFGH